MAEELSISASPDRVREAINSIRNRKEAGEEALRLILAAASKLDYPEKRLALEIFERSLRQRLARLIQKVRKNPIDPMLEFAISLEPDLKLHVEGDKFKLPWIQVFPAVRRGKKLTDFVIEQGMAALDYEEAASVYIAKRVEKAEEYMEKDLPEFAGIEEIKEELRRAAERVTLPQASGGKLRREAFPPCVKTAMRGVGAGMRNYAITVLLTSFLSYARIAPSPAKKDAKISDYIQDIRIIKEEIMPLIEEAAQQCNPPLFEDQPHERMNVYYHLGFGLTSDPKLSDAGKSHWYFVPNCEKIRREAPGLCKPDRLCKEIKNPLTYYIKRRRRNESEGSQP